jgi:hypothetical protein
MYVAAPITQRGRREHGERSTSCQGLVTALETRAAADAPVIMISDSNAAVPTALRAAPIQIFVQHGMPAWLVRKLEALFNSFGLTRRSPAGAAQPC